MAVATSKYDAESSNLSDRSAQIYKDLNLNFTLHPVKKDVSTLSDISAIKRSVRNLINLNLHGKYEKPFHPEIGASIRDALFEPNDSFSINVMENRIRDTLQNYEPRIILEKVEAVTGEAKDFFGDQSNEIRVKVEFYIKNAVTDLIEYETIIQRAR
tara:strand:- start:622 stop:1092 length:471 start_codon:yes stop_codon:yes gene_type:complete